MPNFNYKSVTTDGKIVTGHLATDSKDTVVDMLKQNNQHPIFVEEEKVQESYARKKLKVKEVSYVCRQFHTMLRAGVTIIRAIEVLKSQAENKDLRAVLEKVYVDVQTGSMLSTALRPYPNMFPSFLVNMVESGETSGNLDLVMGKMAKHYEKENKIANKIKAAMIYPAVLLILTVVVVIILLIAVLPMFEDLFASSGGQLPALTQALINSSNFLIEEWHIVLIVSGLVSAAWYLITRSETVRYLLDKYKLKAPVISDVSTKVATSRFASSMSILLGSGVPLLTAIEIVSKIIGNRMVSDLLLEAANDVRRGIELSVIVKRMEVFPPMLDFMIRIGEESGSLEDVLNKTAEIYEEEVDVAIATMTALMEPALIVIMAVVIGTMVIAIAMPMFDMANHIA